MGTSDIFGHIWLNGKSHVVLVGGVLVVLGVFFKYIFVFLLLLGLKSAAELDLLRSGGDLLFVCCFL